MNKRELVATLMSRSGLARTLLGVRRRLGTPWLTVLTYHRVADPETSTQLDDGVIDATPGQFDRQLELLSESCTFIDTDDVVAFFDGRPLPKNPVLITFDDGYLDCHDVALPILQRHDAKAVFFIATSYIDERRMFWWDRISYTLKKTVKKRITLSKPESIELDLSDGPNKAIRRLLTLVKTSFALELDGFLDHLAERAEVAWSAEEECALADPMLMTWDQIRALRDAGMDVQSHTCTHRVLQTLPDDRLAEELGQSRRRLEDELDLSVRTVAYPVGYSVADDLRVRRALDEAGYRVGFTNASGITMTTKRPDPYDVRRIAMDVAYSDDFFDAFIAVPPMARSRAPIA